MDYQFFAKILLVGNSGVGKTSLMMRYTEDHINLNHLPTIGVDYKMKKMQIQNKRVNLQLWDTAGTEKYSTITRSFYKSAHGILLCYSVNDLSSFKNVSNWLAQIKESSPDSVQVSLIANKIDVKEEDRDVSEQDGIDLAAKYGL